MRPRRLQKAWGRINGSLAPTVNSDAQALVAMGKPNEAKNVLENALVKARSQQKRGHEAQLMILLGSVAASAGDRTQAIQYMFLPGSRDLLY